MKYTSQLYVNTLDPFLISGKETTCWIYKSPINQVRVKGNKKMYGSIKSKVRHICFH